VNVNPAVERWSRHWRGLLSQPKRGPIPDVSGATDLTALASGDPRIAALAREGIALYLLPPEVEVRTRREFVGGPGYGPNGWITYEEVRTVEAAQVVGVRFRDGAWNRIRVGKATRAWEAA
jgi:hypothetical protein